MEYQSDISQSVFSFIWAFLIVVFAIPSITYLAHIKNLLDVPNRRTSHESLTPRLGGLAIFAGFMSALTIFGEFGEGAMGIQQVLAGCIIIFFIGLKDDIAPVSAFKKFFVQVLAAGIVMFIGDLRITSFQGFMFVYELEDGISYAFTFLVIIGITNAINLIDGLDGLAGVIIIVICGTFGYFFYTTHSPYAIVAFCLIGALIGFLRYNLIRASIFMGDTGSLVCGFIVSMLAIRFVETDFGQGFCAPGVALGIMVVPIVDTLRVFLIRTLSGKSPFSPDRNHIHHRLVDLGLSQISTVGVLALVNVGFVLLSVNLAHLPINHLVVIVIASASSLSGLMELIYRKKSNSERGVEKTVA